MNLYSLGGSQGRTLEPCKQHPSTSFLLFWKLTVRENKWSVVLSRKKKLLWITTGIFQDTDYLHCEWCCYRLYRRHKYSRFSSGSFGVLNFSVQADFRSTTVISIFKAAAERGELSQLVKDESHQQQRQKVLKDSMDPLDQPWIPVSELLLHERVTLVCLSCCGQVSLTSNQTILTYWMVVHRVGTIHIGTHRKITRYGYFGNSLANVLRCN